MSKLLSRFLQRYIALYILLIPILRYYVLPPSTDLYLLLTFLSAFALFVSDRSSKFKSIHIYSLLFLGWLAVISIYGFYLSEYSAYMLPTSRNNFMLFSIVFLSLVLLSATKFDFDFFIKSYRVIAWILILFLIYQIVSTLILHRAVIHPFSFLEKTIESERNGVLNYYNYMRFSSVFSEPSHFAQYASPLPVLYLYGYKNIIKKSIYFAFITTLPVLLCISGTGIAIMAIVWGYYIFKNVRSFSTGQTVLIVVIVIAVFFIYSNSVGLMTMVSEMSDSNDNKTLDRVTRGFLLFGDLPIDKQLLGIGFQNVMAASKVYHMSLSDVISNGHNEYVCDIASLLLTGGILGFTYVVYLFAKVVKSRNQMFKNISYAILGIFVSEATLGTLTMFYVIMVLSILHDEERNGKKYKVIGSHSRL